MKLLEYGEEFLFDELPKIYNPTQKVFFTYLHDLKSLRFPKKMPRIFTSKELALRMMAYFNAHGSDELLSESDFVYLKPSSSGSKLLLNDGKYVKLHVFQETSACHSLVILLQKDAQITHFYAGACCDLRDIILDKKFTTCLALGVQKLYLDLRRARESCQPDEINANINVIDGLLHHNKHCVRIQLIVPEFGCERFIVELADSLRKLVHLCDEFKHLHGHTVSFTNFQTDTEKARVYVVHEQFTKDYLKKYQEMRKLITLKIVATKPLNDKANRYFELQYSPVPTPFDLKLLASVVHPAHIFGITHKHMEPQRLPGYLRPFCRIPAKPRMPGKNPALNCKPLPQDKVSPTKDTPATYCIRKENFQFIDDDDDDDDSTSRTKETVAVPPTQLDT